jgi:hypothetical protein
MVLVRILMSKSRFEDEVLIKLIVGVVEHVTINIIEIESLLIPDLTITITFQLSTMDFDGNM